MKIILTTFLANALLFTNSFSADLDHKVTETHKPTKIDNVKLGEVIDQLNTAPNKALWKTLMHEVTCGNFLPYELKEFTLEGKGITPNYLKKASSKTLSALSVIMLFVDKCDKKSEILKHLKGELENRLGKVIINYSMNNEIGDMASPSLVGMNATVLLIKNKYNVSVKKESSIPDNLNVIFSLGILGMVPADASLNFASHLKVAADQGHPGAQYWYVLLCDTGIVSCLYLQRYIEKVILVPRNSENAKEWIKKAATNNYGLAKQGYSLEYFSYKMPLAFTRELNAIYSSIFYSFPFTEQPRYHQRLYRDTPSKHNKDQKDNGTTLEGLGIPLEPFSP